MLTFGPIPSRRLGRSVGVNNIPPKLCTYSCVYCQLGRTKKMDADFHRFYTPQEIRQSVEEKIASAGRVGETIDYFSFVPDGEPTLDRELGKAIEEIKETGNKVAVITNSSLIWHEEVRAALKNADWVSVKIDSVDRDVWRKVNRPFRSLDLDAILEGITRFADEYTGKLVTETMLVRNLNDAEEQLARVARFIHTISPAVSYLSVPIRPPAEKWVEPPTEETMIRAYQTVQPETSKVELLIGYEGNEFAFTGDVKNDLLNITSVHPMREDAVQAFLNKAASDWTPIERLLEDGEMVRKTFQGKTFYARKFSPRPA